MKKKIYFADLTHTGKGIHASTFPLGMSFVATYAKEHLADDFEIEIFKFPENLAKALVENPPDILSMSNYSWNFELGYKFSSLAKEKNPNTVVVFGGPNFPVLSSERKIFLQNRKVIDFYIQNEGEIGFVELVKAIQRNDFDINQLKNNRESILNCVYLVEDGLVEGEFKRILDPNVIPSPYLTGMLDKFFELPLVPMLETTRGCPFSCAFCADGIISKSRVARFNSERTTQELDYIAARVKNIDELIITDLNFGMYKEDLFTSKYIAKLQDEKKWPLVVQASLGKNNKKQVIECATILRGTLVMGAAIQSSDPDVLKNIKRNNISLDAYRGFLEYGNSLSKEASTFTEIILALPGDSRLSHFKSLKYGIESGAKTLRMYQAMLLIGTAMASDKMREEYQFLTRFRVIPGGVGMYEFNGKKHPIVEFEEIIVGSRNMSFEDYISCRVMNLFIETYFNNSLFLEVFSALEAMEVPAFDILLQIHGHPELYTEKMKNIVDKFISATKDDLYPSLQEAENFVLSEDVINRYISGDLGINELLVHRADLYLELDDIANVLLNSIKTYLTDKSIINSNVEKYFEELIQFVICKKKRIHQYEEEIAHPFSYNFQEIEQLEYRIDARMLEPQGKYSFKFFHTDEQKNHIQNCLNVYVNTPSGIGRMIQRANLKKMYRRFAANTQEALV